MPSLTFREVAEEGKTEELRLKNLMERRVAGCQTERRAIYMREVVNGFATKVVRRKGTVVNVAVANGIQGTGCVSPPGRRSCIHNRLDYTRCSIADNIDTFTKKRLIPVWKDKRAFENTLIGGFQERWLNHINFIYTENKTCAIVKRSCCIDPVVSYTYNVVGVHIKKEQVVDL
jgi:hypothetical protein